MLEDIEVAIKSLATIAKKLEEQVDPRTRGKYAKNKGKRGERDFAKFLRERGYDARRGRQFSGSPDSPDVVCNTPFHWEVKFVEKLNLSKAYEQAVKDAGEESIPAVAHRRKQHPWLVTMKAEDLFNLLGKQDD